MVDELLLKHRGCSQMVCGEVSMKGSAMKTSMSEMISLGEKEI